VSLKNSNNLSLIILIKLPNCNFRLFGRPLSRGDEFPVSTKGNTSEMAILFIFKEHDLLVQLRVVDTKYRSNWVSNVACERIKSKLIVASCRDAYNSFKCDLKVIGLTGTLL